MKTHAANMLFAWYVWTGVGQPQMADALSYLDHQLEGDNITQDQYENAVRWVRFSGINSGAVWLTSELVRCANAANKEARR